MRSRRCWSRVAAGFMVLAASTAAYGEGRWRETAPGLDIYEGTFKRTGATSRVSIRAVRLDPKRYLIRVLDMSRLNPKASSTEAQRYTGGTLREVMEQRRLVAAINGGFVTSYAFPQPLGLARIGGKDVGAFTSSRTLSGLVCIRAKGSVEILRAAERPGSECRDALQAGPLIVEPKEKYGINASESKRTPYIRSVVCTDDDDIIFVRSDETPLYDLMLILRKDAGEGGIGCDVALNLSGDSDSGLMWREGKQLRTEGSLDASLATALAAFQR